MYMCNCLNYPGDQSVATEGSDQSGQKVHVETNVGQLTGSVTSEGEFIITYSAATSLLCVTTSDGWSCREFTKSSKEASRVQKKEKKDEKNE